VVCSAVVVDIVVVVVEMVVEVDVVIDDSMHGATVVLSTGCGPQINAPFERVRLYGAQQ
jgi:hypothetical protein